MTVTLQLPKRSITPIGLDDRKPNEPYFFTVRHDCTVETMRFRQKEIAERAQEHMTRHGYKLVNFKIVKPKRGKRK